MKFAHIADCHIGGWREPRMRDLGIKAFSIAIDRSIEQKVDFVIIAGDLFNTSLPNIDHLKETVDKLKELKDSETPCYVIPGSHDYSPSGKTMLDVLEKAGLFKNVCRGEPENGKLKLRFTQDPKTGAKITGILGKKGMLDKKFYEDLIHENLEAETGFKIFMFHTLLTEFKPKDLEKMDSAPLSLLPKGFDYYAGGHPHFVMHKIEENHKNICYPGPIFPNSFSELEKLGRGGFYIYDEGKIIHQPIELKKVESFKIDCENLSAEQVEEKLRLDIKNKDFKDTIVTLRFAGKIKYGKVSDIDFSLLMEQVYDNGAYFVMKNTAKLSTPDFEEVKIDVNSVDDIEASLIQEHIGQSELYDKDIEKYMIQELLNVMNISKIEGEKNQDFESRVKENCFKILLER